MRIWKIAVDKYHRDYGHIVDNNIWMFPFPIKWMLFQRHVRQ